MKTKFVIVLLLLSVGLFGVGYFALKRASSETPSGKTLSSAESRPLLKSAKSKPASASKAVASETKIVYVTNQFNWSQVESSDYREYIANLRAVGCPETTIKDIILTDILKLYASQRGQTYHNGREFRFWETDEKRKLNAKQLEQQEKQLASIDKEIPSVLRELLGINYEREMNKYFVDTNEDERKLDFLTPDKRSQLLTLRDEIEGLRERVLERTSGNPSSADIEELQKIEAQRKLQLGKLLSGSELAEFELRTSSTANQLRAELIGFNPSESEFRELFAMHNAIAEKFAFASSDEKAEAQTTMREAIKLQLGEARYAEYELAQNTDFRNACVFAEVYELPVSTAQTIFEIKQIAEAEKQNLLANSNVPESDRQVILREIQAETEKTLRETLGERAYSTYSQGTGKWVQKLAGNN